MSDKKEFIKNKHSLSQAIKKLHFNHNLISVSLCKKLKIITFKFCNIVCGDEYIEYLYLYPEGECDINLFEEFMGSCKDNFQSITLANSVFFEAAQEIYKILYSCLLAKNNQIALIKVNFEKNL